MEFTEKIQGVIAEDPRYKADAYEFLMQALAFTQKKLKRQGHVTGRELLQGVRDFGLEQYGPMTKVVFLHWGIKGTQDFGEIVFTMVRHGMLGKTEEDSLNDFKDVFDFDQALDVFNVRK